LESQVLEGYQLSPQQRHLWPEQQRSPALCARAVLRIEGDLDGAALAAALQDVVDRHEILRTAFEKLPGMDLPMQIVAERALAVLEDMEGMELPEEEPPFDLAQPPLVRFRRARPEPGLTFLQIVLPAVCADARSLANLAAEIARAYRARRGTEEAPADPLQYIEFSEWRGSILEEPEAEPGLAYWRRRRAADPGPPVLPLESRAPADGPFAPAAVEVPLPPPLRELLEAAARAAEVAVADFLLASWAALLSRLAGSAEVTVHVRFDGRKFPELQGALGLFEELLPLTLGSDAGAPFTDLAAGAARAVEEARLWQEYFVPDAGVDLPVVFEPAAERPAAAEMPRFLLVRSVAHSFPFKLKLSMGAHPAHPADAVDAATLWYDARRFTAEEAGRLAGRWLALLGDALARPAAPLAELALLGADERRLVLEAWNDTARPFAAEAPVHRLFEAQADRTPEAPAVLCAGRALSFRALDEQANRMARRLRRLGVAPEALVALCLERSEAMIVALLGILKAGGAYVPLDAGQPRRRLRRMLADARVSLVLTERAFAPAFEDQGIPVVCLEAEAAAIAAESAGRLDVAVLPEHPAYVIFTSGSTGQPKGALIRHRSVANLLAALAGRVYAGAVGSLRVAVNAPLAFDASVKQVIQLLSGHALVVVPEDVRRDGEAFLAFLAGTAVQVLDATPAQLKLLLAAGLEPLACPELRLVLLGGEAIDSPLWRTLAGWNGVRFWNVYGPTECTVDVTAFPLGGALPVLGAPLANVRTFLLDRAGQPVPLGGTGELCVAGEGLARGYVHQPAATAAKFVPDPFGPPGGRLYRTGDLARRLPDGALELIGRSDHQVKIRGFRIELGEIEAVLATCPGLREAAVVAREEPMGDHRDRRLVAYVVPGPSGMLETGDLRDFLRARLPEYMLPTAFVRLEALPLTRNGKVDRGALPDPEKASGRERAAGSQAPRNQVQELLAGLWEEVLGYERIGVEANFFELGGHSLLATQLISRVRQTFQAELPLRALFDAPSIAGLAEAIDGALRAGGGAALPPLVPLPPLERGGALALSFAQERLWVLDRLTPGNPFYNIPLRTRLSGPLDAAALARTFGEIVRRHEILRTRYAAGLDTEGRPVQIIDPPGPFHLPLVDLSALPAAAGEAEALRLAREEAARPIDLAQGPLLRGQLARLGEDEHAALLTTHHIAGDGWSLGVLMREIAVLYEAFRRSRPSPLPELPVQYADFAAWQRGWLQGEMLERQLATWRRRLAGAPPFLEIPTDRPRPEVQRYRGERRQLLLPAGLAGDLRRLCRRERVSLFMALLGTFQALLSRLSGSLDVSVGTPFSGRTRLETEGLIGFFVNTLVLRTQFAGEPGFRDVLGRVREAALEADAHQDLPFEKLVEELQPERSLSHAPLFQTLFVFQNTPQEEREMTGLRLSPLGVETGTAKFDLTLTLSELGDRIGGVLDYDVDLFDGTTAERLLSCFAVLLEGAVTEPERRLSSLPLLRPEEGQALLAEWSAAAGELPATCASRRFFEQAAAMPEAVAAADGQRRMTYRELAHRVEAWARALARRGVGAESVVPLLAERGLDLLTALLAIQSAGGAYLPLDPQQPAARLSHVVAQAGAALALAGEGYRPMLGEVAGGLPRPGPERRPPEVLDLSVLEAEAAVAPPVPLPAVQPLGLAYVIFTSGSTGLPKGAMVHHRGQLNHLLAKIGDLGLGPDDTVVQNAPQGFDISVWQMLAPLLAGGRVLFVDDAAARDPRALAAAVREGGATVLQTVPSLLRALVEAAQADPSVLAALGTLRWMISTGEALPPALARDWLELAPRIRLLNAYGPTECSDDVTHHALHRPPAPAAVRVPVGNPVLNTRLVVVDRGGEIQPRGVPGELRVGGAGVGRGYLGDPARTAEVFRPDPWSAGERLYHTGDLALRRSSGEIEVIGRIDHQVKVRGVRIELGEIEAALNGHPAVREAVAVLRLDLPGGMGLAAFVVPRGGGATPGELRAWMRARLSEAMVPAVFVTLGALPLTANDKVDRHALGRLELSAERAVLAAPSYLPPRDLVELRLCRLWEEMLGVAPVGVRDSFFALGGSSLAAVRLQTRVERAFGWRFDLAALFRAPTVEGLAGLLRRRMAVPASALIELASGGPGRPIFWLHPAGGEALCYADLARHLGADRPHYGLRARGLRDGETPAEELRAMAAAYLEEVRAVDPEGPYLLGGWSLGGVLAFEMACQLRAAGREVAMVALLDTQAPDPARSGNLSDRDLLGAFAQGLGLRADGFTAQGEDEGLDAELAGLLEQARAAGIVPADLDLADVRRIFAVHRGNSRALRGYAASSYTGRLTLFRAAGRGNPADLTRGWDALAPAVEVHEVPGDHFTLVREPHVGGLAARLRACLETTGV